MVEMLNLREMDGFAKPIIFKVDGKRWKITNEQSNYASKVSLSLCIIYTACQPTDHRVARAGARKVSILPCRVPEYSNGSLFK